MRNITAVAVLALALSLGACSPQGESYEGVGSAPPPADSMLADTTMMADTTVTPPGMPPTPSGPPRPISNED